MEEAIKQDATIWKQNYNLHLRQEHLHLYAGQRKYTCKAYQTLNPEHNTERKEMSLVWEECCKLHDQLQGSVEQMKL